MKRKVVALLTAVMVMAMGSMTVLAAPSSGNEGGNNVAKPPVTGEEKPGDTQKPDDTQKPGDTQKPDDTQKPGDTQKPDDTQKPGDTQTPGTTDPGTTTPVENPNATPAQVEASFAGTTVSAAPKNSYKNVKGTGVTISEAAAGVAEMFANSLNDAIKNPVQYLSDLRWNGVAIPASLQTAMKEGKKVQTEMLAVVDLKPTADSTGTYTLELSGVRAGSVLYLLHDNGSDALDVIPAYVSGKNTIVFHWSGSFSPFAVVQTYVEGTEAATAPQTGNSFPAAAGAMAVICLAGVAVCGKKVKFN